MTDKEIIELAIQHGVMSWSEQEGEVHYTVDTDAASVIELVKAAIAKVKEQK
jgi:hypothetical protein